VDIGGKSYVCPVKSVSISTATTLVFHKVVPNSNPEYNEVVDEPKVTAINDIFFDNYHVFRTEMRILPPKDEDPKGNSSEPAPTAPPAASPQRSLASTVIEQK
jgi:hypothetical protein